VFALSRKAHVNFIMCVRLSASISAVLTGMISMKFGVGILYESFVFEIGHNIRAVYLNTYVSLIVAGDTELP
jgi:hypothetical protein